MNSAADMSNSAGPAATPIPIPPGIYAVTGELDTAIRRAAAAPAGDGIHAHPIMAFVAALGGMGVSVAEVIRLCGSSIARGPVLARTVIRYQQPMLVDRDYAIGGTVTAIVRKPSRRYGAADHVTLALTVGTTADPFAEVDIGWVMPVDPA